MAYSGSLYGAPADNVAASATSIAFGSPDSAYLGANAKDGKSAIVAKSTATSDTLTVTLTGSFLVVGAFLFNTNATTITINGSTSMPVAAREGDGQTTDPWLDLGAGITASVFTFAMSKSGSAKLQVGEVALVTALRQAPLLYGLDTARRRPGNEVHVTRLGHKHKWISSVKNEVWSGECNRHDSLAALLDLEAQSNGLGKAFPFVPLLTVNRAAWVEFSEEAISHARADLNSSVIRIQLEEQVKGVPPSAA